MLTSLTVGSIVFLILYATIFLCLTFLYITRQIKFKSRWSFLYLHVLIRLASQGVGIGFGVQGFDNVGLLIGYLILGAEGYFSLVLCTARFLISFHEHHFGESWLEKKSDYKDKRGISRFLVNFQFKGIKDRPMGVVHWLLIAANAIIIAGGSVLAGDSNTVSSAWSDSDNVKTAKGMRAAGQAIFLLINVVLAFWFVVTLRQYRSRYSSSPFYGHPTLAILMATWPFLFIRGVFGVCQAAIDNLNYYNPENYNEFGFTDEFVVKEEVLATAMEWTSCTLLVLTFITSRHDPKKKEVSPDEEVGEEQAAKEGSRSNQ